MADIRPDLVYGASAMSQAADPRSNSEPQRTTIQLLLAVDALCLAAITLLSALPYLPRLGFYTDDWGLLADFSTNWRGLSGAIINFPDRPVQGLYLASLFELFGLQPLGYHVVNTVVLASCGALFFLLLVRLGFARRMSFAAALLFIMLPQLSTVRVWYAAFQIPLSLMLMLLSMHCQLSFVRRGDKAWLFAAILTALLSVGAYEIFAPLLAGFALAVGFVAWRGNLGVAGNRSLVPALLVGGAVVAGAIYKLAISSRVGPVADPSRYILGLRQLFRLDYDWRTESSLNIIATPRAHFWEPVRGWWIGAQELLGGAAGVGVTILAIVISILAWWRLSIAHGPASASAPGRMLLLGVAAFLLGNVTFLIVPAVVFTSTGIGNRVHVAAALGVAMILAAAISLLTDALSRRGRGKAFTVVVVAVTAAAFVRLATIERYWAEAPAIQGKILDAARADLRDLPAGSTVILAGVCPYHGPAVVFESPFDVGGALTLALGRPVAGDIVSPRMTRTRGGLKTSIYEEPSNYPYGSRLYLYNPSTHRLHRLTDEQAAARYLAGPNLRLCPGYVARGVEV